MLIITENHNLGEIMVDHRNAAAPSPFGKDFIEMPTYTCSHCERVIVMNPARKRERYTCRGCNHMICDDCGAIKEQTGKCRTFAQIVDEYLEQTEKKSENPSQIILT